MRKIAMVGTAPSTRGMVPQNGEWEVWGQADYWQDLKVIDRWFEFAPRNKLVQQFPEYWEHLKTVEYPVWMRDVFEEVPQSRKFPFDEIETKFGREFMTATLCWMMGQAVTEHIAGDQIEVIGLWGYDMAMDAEYSHQRPGIRHMEWICNAYVEALGHPPITVLVPKGSDLAIQSIPYPFAEDDPMVMKIRARKSELGGRLAKLRQDRGSHEHNIRVCDEAIKYFEGAMEDLLYFERMACGVKDPAA